MGPVMRLEAGVNGKRERAIRLSPLLGIFGLVLAVALACYVVYYVWLVMLDSRGTFYAATDTADVDGDGDLDVLLHNVRRESEFTAFSVPTLWINEGDGRFGPREIDVSGNVGGGWASAAGDLDGDADADIALFIGYELRLLLYQGGAQRGETGTFLDGLAVSAAALDDLDRDGDLDLFVAVTAPPEGRNRNPADRVVFNDGTGSFADSGQRLGDSDSTAVALEDLDGDGEVDAAVGDNSRVALWINQGGAQHGQEGEFALAEEEMAAGEIRSLFLSDLDGDGDMDALVGGRQQATIWWNDGRATFVRSGQRFRISKRHGLSVGDFDGDDRPDIFAAAYDDDYRLWLNEGNGTFRSAGVGSINYE